MKNKPLILIILDGWGYSEKTEANAIAEAQTPFFDSLWKKYPHTLLDASQQAVGLPEGQIGNSEVGHLTIGTGRSDKVVLFITAKARKSDEGLSMSAFT